MTTPRRPRRRRRAPRHRARRLRRRRRSADCSAAELRRPVCASAYADNVAGRAVVQRARAAGAAPDDQVRGQLARPGLVVLVGVTHTDTADDASRLAAKLHELRILDGEQSAAQTGAPLLV